MHTTKWIIRTEILAVIWQKRELPKRSMQTYVDMNVSGRGPLTMLAIWLHDEMTKRRTFIQSPFFFDVVMQWETTSSRISFDRFPFEKPRNEYTHSNSFEWRFSVDSKSDDDDGTTKHKWQKNCCTEWLECMTVAVCACIFISQHGRKANTH